MKINQFEEEFLGRKVVFSERTARNVFKQVQFQDTGIEDEFLQGVTTAAMVISDSLENYISRLSFLIRWRYKRIYSPRRIMEKASTNQILKLSARILSELEGLEIPKEGESKKKIPPEANHSVK